MKVHWSGLMEAREEEIALIQEGERGKIGKIGLKKAKWGGHRWNIGRRCRLRIANTRKGCVVCVPNTVLRVGSR